MNLLRLCLSGALAASIVLTTAPRGEGQAAPAVTAKAESPQFRGPNRDGHSADTGLLRQWPSGGPSKTWEAKGAGRGYSSVSVAGGKVYTMGDNESEEFVTCFNEATGKLAWKTAVGPAWTSGRPDWQSSRSTPTVDGDALYALTPHGGLLCLEGATGKVRWRKDLKRDFGGRVGGWGYAEAPLVDGDNLVCTPGGRQGTVLALKKATGAPAWQCREITDAAEYTSLTPAEIGGVKQYLLLTMQSVAGVAAKDGKLLWRADRQGKTAVAPAPVYKDDTVFVTSGYGVGCNAFKVTASGGRFSAEQVYSGDQMAVHHGGAVVVGDHVYAADDRSVRCVEIKTGKLAWQDRSVGKGSITYADGHLVVRSERAGSGAVALVEASPSGYKEKGRFNLPDRSNRPCWSYPVVAGGKLYLREGDSIHCFDVKAK